MQQFSEMSSSIVCICKVANTLVWRIPDNSSATELHDVFGQQLSCIEPVKNITISELQEHYLKEIEHIIKYYNVQLFEPLDVWKMLYSQGS